MSNEFNREHSSLGQLTQQEIHHLITVSTGVIDVFVIPRSVEDSILLPQNIVISVFETPVSGSNIQWQKQNLAVWNLQQDSSEQALALVIEGETEAQRFIILCDAMPQSMRMRISEVIDDEKNPDAVWIFKYVKRAEQRYIVPNLQAVEQMLGIAEAS